MITGMSTVKKWYGLTIVIAFMCICCSMFYVKADDKMIFRVPADAKIYISGTLLQESQCVARESLTGRIHEMAAEAIGTPYQYKEYQIPQSELQNVQVFDWMLRELPYKETEDGVRDYTLPSDAFCRSVEEIITEAARAYYNRVSGLPCNFSRYYQQGSNAYDMIIISDNATKWGRFIAPGQVSQITCSDIFVYSDCAFSATATVDSEEVSGYAEHFDIHLFFQNDGNGWRVTNFTFMP